MNTEPYSLAAPVSEDDLHALVDGRLEPARREAVLQALQRDPQAHATWTAWQQQREALAGLHRGLLDAGIPAAMQGVAQRAQRSHRQADSVWRWGGIAAGVLCAFGLGWFARAALAPSDTALASSDAALLSLADGAGGRNDVRAFVHQAAVAHMVYAPEVRHPVEVTAAEQQHLVQWLSKRLNRPLKVPDLSAQGYALVGGRLLPGADGARAQFMFQDPAGVRITLYIGAMQPGGAAAPTMPASRSMAAGPPMAGTASMAATPSMAASRSMAAGPPMAGTPSTVATPSTAATPSLTATHPASGAAAAVADLRESAFRFSDDGPVPGFYWVEQGFGYALAGQLTRAQLMQLAQAVYRQL